MIVTTEQAAAELGVSVRRVQQLAAEGRLTPCRRGAKPLRFRLDDVIEYQHQTMRQGERDTLDALRARWRDIVADVAYA